VLEGARPDHRLLGRERSAGHVRVRHLGTVVGARDARPRGPSLATTVGAAMSIELTSTNASAVAAALLSERRKAGSPAMGMVMTFLVVTDESDHYDALKVARAVAREHPARILGIIRRSARGRS